MESAYSEDKFQYIRLTDDMNDEVFIKTSSPVKTEVLYKEYQDWCSEFALTSGVPANSFSRWLVTNKKNTHFIMPIEEFHCK